MSTFNSIAHALAAQMVVIALTKRLRTLLEALVQEQMKPTVPRLRTVVLDGYRSLDGQTLQLLLLLFIPCHVFQPRLVLTLQEVFHLMVLLRKVEF